MKNFKIIFINVIFTILVLILIDYLLYAFDFYNVTTGCYEIDGYDIKRSNMRQENNLYYDKNKGEIVTIGCSFIYGYNIDDEDTLAYKLQEITNRKVYNLGYSGTGIQHVLWQIENAEFFKRNDVNPEYVIYVFITDHMRRMYLNYFLDQDKNKYLKYKLKNGNLISDNWDKVVFTDYIKVLRISKQFNYLMYLLKSDDTKFDFFKLHIEQAKKSLSKKFSNTKFVIVVYNPEVGTLGFPPFKTTRWKELENEGFIIIDLSEPQYDYLKTKGYIQPNDAHHPTGMAWENIANIIKEKLNL